MPSKIFFGSSPNASQLCLRRERVYNSPGPTGSTKATKRVRLLFCSGMEHRCSCTTGIIYLMQSQCSRVSRSSKGFLQTVHLVSWLLIPEPAFGFQSVRVRQPPLGGIPDDFRTKKSSSNRPSPSFYLQFTTLFRPLGSNSISVRSPEPRSLKNVSFNAGTRKR